MQADGPNAVPALAAATRFISGIMLEKVISPLEKALDIGGLDVLRYSGLPVLRVTGTVTHESWPWSG